VTFIFTQSWPPLSWLPWERNLGQNWLQLGLRKRFLRVFCAYKEFFGDLGVFCAYREFFGMGHRMLPIAFLLRPTPVAMATKFKTKWAITRLVWKISARFLRLQSGYWEWTIEWYQSQFDKFIWLIVYQSVFTWHSYRNCLENYRLKFREHIFYKMRILFHNISYVKK